KEIKSILLENFGIDEGLDFVFYITPNNNLYMMNNDMRDFDLEDKRVNTIGIYVGELKHKEIRLSIEGSYFFGKLATKNVYEVDSKLAKMWMYGLDIPCKDQDFENSLVIVKNKENGDYMGSGRYKEGKILNHVPKGRRIHE
ncbi:hypothetical protein KY334_06695, partial [Candidatus Woesearchaeota archaeon]|nr:hypothetical protein [Candidatus Woesearchaeota archaeon]